jgi:hypothetical protein
MISSSKDNVGAKAHRERVEGLWARMKALKFSNVSD